MIASASPLVRFVRFLGKVKFTTILLLAGVVIMTIGTVLESRESRSAAWSAIYGTPWFDVFLFLIGVNLVVAVVNRIPIRRHQWPFVLTHFAIVMLLAGAWISTTFGYEGRLVVREGSQESRLLLDASELRTRWQPGATDRREGIEAALPLPTGRRWAGRVVQPEREGRPEIRIAEFVEDGVASIELAEAGPEAPPGVEIAIARGPEQARRWLIAGDPRFQRQDLGPVELELRRSGSETEPPEPLATAPTRVAEVSIVPTDGGTPVRIPLPEQLGREVPCGPGVVAVVERFLVDARVVDGQLTEVASTSENPAAVVAIRSAQGTESHTVFARFPEFSGVRGRDPKRPLVSAVSLSSSALPSKPTVVLGLGSAEGLEIRVGDARGERPVGTLGVGRTLRLEGLGLDLALHRLLPHARPEIRVRPSADGRESGAAYLRIEARRDGAQRSLWLARGGPARTAQFDGVGALEVAFAPQTRPLPFAIALDAFELIRHPGSSRPSEYRSDVRVVPTSGAIEPRTATISMNRPLDVAGFRLFQSSYQLGTQGGPDTTILTVSYDPGVPVVYVSFALLILGIAWGLRGVRPASEPAGRAHRAGAERRTPRPPARTATARRARRSGRVARSGLLLAALAGLAPLAALPAAAAERELPFEATGRWAILADGRVKPLRVFANETVLAVTGRERFDGLSALAILWGYRLASPDFADRHYLRIDSLELKAELGLPSDARRFSFNALSTHPRFRALVERALQKQRRRQDLTRLEDDALAAYDKLGRVAALMSGEALTIVPLPDASGAWRSPVGLKASPDAALRGIDAGLDRLAAAYAARDGDAFRREAEGLAVALRDLNPSIYPSESRIDLELFYDGFNPFGMAWKLYLAGFLGVMLLGFSERRWGYRAGTLLILAGFVFHTVGIGARWAIAQRAPVSDMYESLVFMGWGAIALGLVPEFTYQKRFLALASGLLGFLCLAFAENLPIDSAINPLVPVLAHTYWLSIHVMTIMLSYSALAVAMVLGHVMLFAVVFRRQPSPMVGTLSRILYRTLQIGLLFLTAGIAFGAIWANESWGRYWGWDPKETWSLITLFVYLAIIHARFAGWLGHFGLATSAILGFLAVVMTYYGVNFILAAGLHSYGFSEGGRLYAAVYAGVEIAVVAAAYLRYRSTAGPLRVEWGLPGGGHPHSTDREFPS